MRTISMWEAERLTMEHSIELTIESLEIYGPLHKHWVIAFSGGKDSTAVVTLIAYLIESGRVQAPQSLTVLYADTRMELPPLQAAAMNILEVLEKRGIKTQVVLPELDERYMVYMLGRGVPPAKNRFRWCTSQLKIDPMERALADLREQYGEKFLMLTGVRIGESAARDQRIAVSCSKDGAECGQGWYQEATPESVADVLAPCLHWRVCHVWDWLTFHAPGQGFPTQVIGEVYGGDEKTEINARTGCVGCNLASKDTALDTVLKRLRPLYADIIRPQYRLRKDGTDRRKDGTLAANPMRMGPLTMEARRMGLAEILAIQGEVNAVADALGRPCIDLINQEEHSRILELIEANTWPQKWTGNEIRGDAMIPQVVADGIVQPLLLTLEEEVAGL
jgi:DNA sulfur modification protein DndC